MVTGGSFGIADFGLQHCELTPHNGRPNDDPDDAFRYSGGEGHSVPSSAGELMGALEMTVLCDVPGEVLIVTLASKIPQNCPQVSLLGKLAAA